MKTIRKKIQLFSDLYYWDVEVCFSDDICVERNKPSEVKRFGKEYLNAEGRWGLCSFNIEKGDCVIYLNYKAGAGLIAHESWHCVNRMIEWIHADLENEVVAYSLDYLVQQIHNFKVKRR